MRHFATSSSNAYMKSLLPELKLNRFQKNDYVPKNDCLKAGLNHFFRSKV